MASALPNEIKIKPNIISLDEEDEENKENLMQNSLNKNYPLKNTKDKSKKMAYNKFEEKGNKKRKENKNRKKLALLGLNKPNSSRNPQILNLNLASNIDINIDINNINNNNLIKSSDISININKKETNKKNKIQIFRIDKVPKNPNEKENQNLIKKEKEKPDYLYLNFNFQNSQENISYVGEYLEEIYVNLLLEETQATTKPKFGYMNTQPEINEIMRAILIDWIIDVHLRFNLRQETLFMTIWLIDTYLSFAFVHRDKLQLLGITCLLISCKSHEIYYPQNDKLIEMTDNAYSKEEMLTMENEILKKLNFFIVCPNPIDFYNILSKMFNFEKKQYYLGNYFIESALVNYQILKYSSSVIASSCTYLVMKYYRINGYQKLYNNFIINEQFPEDVIKDAAKEIYVLVDNLSKSKFKSVKKKYSLTQFENVSEIL
jgi:cyclin B